MSQRLDRVDFVVYATDISTHNNLLIGLGLPVHPHFNEGSMIGGWGLFIGRYGLKINPSLTHRNALSFFFFF